MLLILTFLLSSLNVWFTFLIFYWLGHWGETGRWLPPASTGPVSWGQTGWRPDTNQRETEGWAEAVFTHPPHAISITPLPVSVITSCQRSVSTYCWLYAHICPPVTHIHKDRAPWEEASSCLLRFREWLVILMIYPLKQRKTPTQREIYEVNGMEGITGTCATNMTKKKTETMQRANHVQIQQLVSLK